MPFTVLIVSGSMFFPFITGKNFTFRIITEIISLLWIILMMFDPRYRPKKSWVLIFFAVFVGAMFLSSIFGENFYRSFWSNYERMEGLVTFIHLLAYFLVLSSVMKTEKMWAWFFNTNLGASLIVAAYGLLQLIDPAKYGTHQGNRLDATLGNASYLAIYMVFNIFLALMFFFKQKSPFRWVYAVIIALESVVLYYTETRGSILGIILGFLISAILIAFLSKEKKVKIRISAALAAVVAAVSLFIVFKTSDFVKSSSVLRRFADISFTETTTESRLTIWKMSWEAFKEKPLLGWGPENYNLVFNKYYEPKLWKQEPWFDRAHNVFFDRLTTNGIVGFIAYLGIFGAALYHLWARKKGSGLSIYDASVLTGLFAAYFVNNLFVFDNLISLIAILSFLAYIHSRTVSVNVAPAIGGKALSVDYLKASYAVVVGIGFAFIIYFVNVPAIMASRSMIDALRYSGTAGGLQKSFDSFTKAISYNSFGSLEAREHLASFAMQVYDQQNLDPEFVKFKESVANFAVEELKKQNIEYPNDAREMIFLGALYNKMHRFEDAVAIMQKTVELSPKKQQLYFELGTSYLNKGDYNNGLETLKKAYELDPSFLDARKIYSVAAIFADKKGLAEEIMKDYGGTLAADERFLRAYAQKKDNNSVIAILNKFIELNPNNFQYRLMMAGVDLETGKRQEAVKELEKAIELNPQFKQQGEYYIKEIKAGRNP